MSDKNKRSEEQAMKTSDVLLPCPFCCGEVCLEIGYDDETPMEFWTIKSTKKEGGCTCEDIFVESYYFDEDGDEKEDAKQKLIKAWNTRRPMERIMENLKAEANECRVNDEIEKEYYLGMWQGYRNAIGIIEEEVAHD